jgi:NAD(P)H-quinone oxidoreductase subunit J
MSPKSPEKQPSADVPVAASPQLGPVSQWLTKQGFDHDALDADHLGVEQIGVEALFLQVIAAALKSNGFDYLQCQGGYDEGPGERLVCFYHFVAMAEFIDGKSEKGSPVFPAFMACSVVRIGKSVKPSTCLAFTLKVIPIPSAY